MRPSRWPGKLSASRDGLDRTVKVWREGGIPWVTVTQVCLGGVELARGDWTAARKELEDAVAHALPGSFGGIEESGLLRLLTYSGDKGAVALLDRLAARLPRLGANNGPGSWYALMASVESAAPLDLREHASHLIGQTSVAHDRLVNDWSFWEGRCPR